MSTYDNYSKGSEWRKWDLHIHSNASDGTASPQEIIEEAITKGISVIALTDHHTVKNVDEIKRIGNERGIKVIAGIEFRTEYGSSSVHLIGLFPDFYENQPLDAKALNELILCPLGLSGTEIIKKGKDADASITNDETAFKKGMFLVQVDFKKASDIIRKYGGVVSVHAGSKANSVDVEMKHLGSAPKNVKELYDSLGTVKEELMKNHIDICEIRKENDSEEFYYTTFGLPSIIASDAHEKQCVGEKYVWIKAEKTFEGLKQILCEPTSRVILPPSNPVPKKLYNIIEKIKFVDNSGNKKFPPYEIGFNPDLNAIIGGKSSGKSLLMHLMAKTLGDQTDTKNYTTVLSGVDFEVYYADDPNKKRTIDDKRIIEFLPQLHIEKIVQNKSNNNDFNNFVESLIRQEDDIQTLYNEQSVILSQAKSNLDDSIKNWIKSDGDLSKAIEALKPLGDKIAISNEITNIKNKIDDLTKQAGLTKEELDLYKKLNEANSNLQRSIDEISFHNSEINKLKIYTESSFLDTILNSIKFESTDTTVFDIFATLKQAIQTSVKIEINNFIAELNKEQETIQKTLAGLKGKIDENNKQLAPILAKNKIQSEITSLGNSIEVENKKLKIITDKETEIEELRKKRDENKFIDYYREMIGSYDTIATSINNKIGLKWTGEQTKLTLTATSIFNNKVFTAALSSVINVQSYLSNQLPNCGFNASDYDFIDKATHISNIETILKRVIDDENRFNNFKQNGTTESLLRALFQNCNYIDFDIKKGEDSLRNMSEGKKGIVLLQLYLSLSKADYPILIDQPEDNLDNRTVYVELNDYIKQCKQRRQIIMVSHNANPVVNTDAENIIVANQSGEDGKDNKAFKFEYVNGALENTFVNETEKGILYKKGIREHVCEILEGGTDAFKKREEKYNLK